MIGEMVEETVTISTQMFARILAMVSMARLTGGLRMASKKGM